MNANFKIDGIEIGGNSPVFIIAELSANHLQKKSLALETIKAAKEVGADAIKLQTYTPDTITIECNNQYFQDIHKGTLWEGKTLYELYQNAYTPWEWHEELYEAAKKDGLACFSSPFDKTAVDFLEGLNTPAYKIASFEITDIPLIEYAASKGKPVIISTGIATISEIQEAVEACRRQKNDQIAILKCTSAYPAPFEEINLNTMPNLAQTFNVVPGLSDHTLGIEIPIAATALGARIIEKHFIMDKSIGGPDVDFSLNVKEFKELVKSVRNTEKALGQVKYTLSDKIKDSRKFSRSLFIVEDVKKGEKFTTENVKSIRPGFGLEPKHLKDVIDKKANQDIEKGTPLSWELLNNKF